MKKLTTKLLMSIIAVAFAFVALGTSTYAWFTMSTSVSATGMQVTAKSNATYLLIGAADNANDKTASDVTIAAAYQNASTNANKQVYPAAYFTAAGTLGSTATEAGKWYTASNKNADDANDEVINVKSVTEGDADYMLTYKVWLTLSEDSEDTNDYRIKVTFSKGTNDDAAVSAVVVLGQAAAHGKFALNSTNNEATTSSTVALAHNASIEVTVYVYIDGDSTNVYSDYITGANAQTITGTAALTFDLVKNN